MIYINLDSIDLPQGWEQRARDLTEALLVLPPDQRTAFINDNRGLTWADKALVDALKKVVGDKCWYSEVSTTGQDPNVDHFRPKGRVTEIDIDSKQKTGQTPDGYWWLAFEWKNFRYSSVHANQRRVDIDTHGGKADYFPIEGQRAPEKTKLNLIDENVLPFDPCSLADMSLMWFGPDGIPGYAQWERDPTVEEDKRMKATVWLYHLNKREIVRERASYMDDIRRDLEKAHTSYTFWRLDPNNPSFKHKTMFEAEISGIKKKIADNSPYAGAKRCAVRIASARYNWILEFKLI